MGLEQRKRDQAMQLMEGCAVPYVVYVIVLTLPHLKHARSEVEFEKSKC